MTKRTLKEEPQPQTYAVVGRELLERYQHQSEEMADTLKEGQAVEYYDEGWRYGHVETLPAADEKRYGQVRVVHQVAGRVWVEARDVKPLELDWTQYYAWRRGEGSLS